MLKGEKKLGPRTTSLMLVYSLLVLIIFAGCEPVPEILPYREPEAGMAVRYDFKSTVDGLNLPCSIYLPKGYDPSLAYPMWVELHALEGVPIVSNNPYDIFSNEIKRIADEKQWIVLSPWGRQLGSYYIDGVKKDGGPNQEPRIIDDLSSLDDWRTVSGNWSATGDITRQSESSDSWKELVRSGSFGQDYTVMVKLRETSRSGSESAMGINLHRDPDTGDCYHVDLYTGDTDSETSKYVLLFRYSGGTWETIYRLPYDWKLLQPGSNWINLEVSFYAGNIMIIINDGVLNLQPGDHNKPYGLGRMAPEEPVSGEVSLCSKGGVHEFGEMRVLNEYEYGETDVLDCIYRAMEKFNIEEDRIYASGLSMGGTGAYVLGIHNPGLFAAVSPNAGASDLVYDFE